MGTRTNRSLNSTSSDLLPSERVPIVRLNPQTHQRESVLLRWGLVPSWAKDPAIGSRLINARAETVAVKPAFRESFRQRRCLLVTDGLYLWKARGKGRKKQPFVIRMKDRRPFGVGAIWDRWQPAEGEVVESCAVITVPANDLVRPINDRMPVIIAKEDYEAWLDPEVFDLEEIEQMMRPYSGDDSEVVPGR